MSTEGRALRALGAHGSTAYEAWGMRVLEHGPKRRASAAAALHEPVGGRQDGGYMSMSMDMDVYLAAGHRCTCGAGLPEASQTHGRAEAIASGMRRGGESAGIGRYRSPRFDLAICPAVAQRSLCDASQPVRSGAARDEVRTCMQLAGL